MLLKYLSMLNGVQISELLYRCCCCFCYSNIGILSPYKKKKKI